MLGSFSLENRDALVPLHARRGRWDCRKSRSFSRRTRFLCLPTSHERSSSPGGRSDQRRNLKAPLLHLNVFQKARASNAYLPMLLSTHHLQLPTELGRATRYRSRHPTFDGTHSVPGERPRVKDSSTSGERNPRRLLSTTRSLLLAARSTPRNQTLATPTTCEDEPVFKDKVRAARAKDRKCGRTWIKIFASFGSVYSEEIEQILPG